MRPKRAAGLHSQQSAGFLDRLLVRVGVPGLQLQRPLGSHYRHASGFCFWSRPAISLAASTGSSTKIRSNPLMMQCKRSLVARCSCQQEKVPVRQDSAILAVTCDLKHLLIEIKPARNVELLVRLASSLLLIDSFQRSQAQNTVNHSVLDHGPFWRKIRAGYIFCYPS